MKKFLMLAIFVLIVPFCVVGCEHNKNVINSYFIQAVYDNENQTLSCHQRTTYHNSSQNALDEISFFLYPNSFEEGKIAVSKSNFEKAYPNVESYGNITFSNIEIESKKCDYVLSENHNIVRVKLFETIFPTESVCIDFDYVVVLANINHRLGYNESTTNFGGFFPIACVYENGFVENDFSLSGDPFYSETANFVVEISYPDEFVLASTGEQTKTEHGTKCVAENVRDFCFVLSKKFAKISADVEGVCVNYYYHMDSEPEKHLQTAVKALETFSNLFGEYPYKQLSVVETGFCFGGMEYPNIVLISDDIDRDVTFDYVIVHEIAHQWWYGVVGNNEYSQSWVDESLTEYSTLLFFEENQEYGIQYKSSVENAIATYKNFVKIYTDVVGDVNQSMNRNLAEFATEPEYVNCIYTKGVIMFDSVRETLGKQKFLKCLKLYYHDFKFQIASGQDLINCFSKKSKRNMQNFFNAWLDGNVAIN